MTTPAKPKVVGNVTAHARTRATHTLVQGAIAALLIGAATGTLQALHADHFTWATVGTSVATAAVMSVLSYVEHAWLGPYLGIKNGTGGSGKA